MLRNAKLVDTLYILYDNYKQTYNICGGSSTPAKPRVFASKEQAEHFRDRYWPGVAIVRYKIDRELGLYDE